MRDGSVKKRMGGRTMGGSVGRRISFLRDG
jgi:hypothetical protein